MTAPLSHSIHSDFPQLSVTYCNFQDAWRFHKTLHFFELDVNQLSAGRFLGSILEVATPHLQLDRHFHNSQLKLAGSPTKSWSFGIPINPLNLLFDYRYQLLENYLLLAPPQSSFTLTCQPPYELYVIYFSEDYFVSICEKYHLPDPAKLLGEVYHQPSVISLAPPDQQQFKWALGTLFDRQLTSLWGQSLDSPLFPFSAMGIIDHIEERIVVQIINVLAKSRQIQPKKIVAKRMSHLYQAEEFIRAYAKAQISIMDISHAVGISQRTLEYLFKDFYGISPCAYLKCFRLNQLRQSLHHCNLSGNTINHLAAEWGFWHSGQLAKDYFNLFGELPSQTN
ncbi:MAG: helix-turn-helix domain-containing protein [Synechocystis sp.]|nr:helix-turn-helix domain-containing protein [Synechocystis sp.]